MSTDKELQHKFEERAAIMEFDGGLPRAEAERRAQIECAHSINGPSSLFRRKLCPGSYHAENGQPELPGNDAQSDGEKWHADIAKCIKARTLLPDVDDEVVEAWRIFLNLRGAFSTVLVENTFSMKALPECGVGTPDLAMCEVFSHGMIVDWKFTHIDPESAAGNLQLQAYAIELCEAYNLSSVEVVLACVLSKRISRHTYTSQELMAAKKHIQSIIANAMRQDAPRVMGEHCRYCRAASSCLSGTGMNVDEIQSTDMLPAGIHPDTLGALAIKSEAMSLWMTAIKSELLERLKNGEVIPGWTLGQTRATRRWTCEDEPALIEMLRNRLRVTHEQFCELKVLTPAQIEKKFKVKMDDMVSITHGVKAVRAGVANAKKQDETSKGAHPPAHAGG